MDLEVVKEKGKFYVRDRETGETLNDGKPFSSRKAANDFIQSKMSTETLAGAGEKLLPKRAPMMEEEEPMGGMMGGGKGMPGMLPGGALPGMPTPGIEDKLKNFAMMGKGLR